MLNVKWRMENGKCLGVGGLLRFISFVNVCNWKRHRKGKSVGEFFKRLRESFKCKHEDRNSIKLFRNYSIIQVKPLNIYLI